jgi:hypothetical protein
MLWRDHDDEVVLYEIEGSMYGVGMVMEDCDDENRDMEGRR